MKEYKVGIIGFGTVGAGVAENLLANADVIAKRTGVRPTLTKIADLDITTDRGVKIPDGILTTDAASVIDSCDIVVELVGGTTIAGVRALEEGGLRASAMNAVIAAYERTLELKQ